MSDGSSSGPGGLGRCTPEVRRLHAARRDEPGQRQLAASGHPAGDRRSRPRRVDHGTNRDQVDAYFDSTVRSSSAASPSKAPTTSSVSLRRSPASFSPSTATCRPRARASAIYHSTPYPADKMILFHNESSHLPDVADCGSSSSASSLRGAGRDAAPRLPAGLPSALDPALLEEFEKKGLMYVRNFSAGIDVPWQDFFHTTDQAEVERTCAEAGMSCEWKDGDGLRIRSEAPAVVDHPRTGEKLFFNQMQLHHVSCLDAETRDVAAAAVRRGGHAAERVLRRRHADPGRGDGTRSASSTRSCASSGRGRRAT